MNNHTVIEIENSSILGGCKSYGEEVNFFFNNLNNLECSLLTLNSKFEVKSSVLFQSNVYLNISDFDISKGICVIGGGFQGDLTINNVPSLSAYNESCFVLCQNLTEGLLWAKSFPSSKQSELQDIEVDYWGDLILGISYSGDFETGIGRISSLGEEDLVILNCKLSNANTLLYKKIGGLGKEKFHSIKTANWGTHF